MNPVELVLTRVKGAKKSGPGWMAPCPAHADGKPSLHISVGTEGKALLKCHAGCTTEAVVEALGITMNDLFTPREEPIRWEKKVQPGNGGPRTVTKYEIRDTSGNVVAVHGRSERPGEEKSMWWELPSGMKGLGGIQKDELPLYGIDRLPREGPVVVVEGEKAADALINNGIAAVGTVTGAGTIPKDDVLRPLLSRPVYLWPDADEKGRKHMDALCASLVRLGHQNIKVITWANAPEKGDAADLVALEGWRDDYDALVADAVKIKSGKPPIFASLAELLANPRKQTWLVKRLIERPSTNLFFGPSGGGKTFVAVDLSGATATDGSWMGKPVAGGIVFYLAGEGQIGLQRRFKAWQMKKGVTIPADRLYVSTVPVKLDEPGALQVEQEIERIARENNVSPALVVVDTLARMLPSGADENTAKDMGTFINIVDRIRDRFDCVMVIIHHTPVQDDRRARGSSALKAAMDSELCIVKRSATRLAEWTKLKDLPEEPHPQEFVLERELLGQDEDGEFITSVVVEWKGRAEARTTITPTKTEILGLETLRAAIATAGGPVQLDAWRFVFNSKHWGDNNKAKREAFRRVRESLVTKGLIEVADNNYTIKAPRK